MPSKLNFEKLKERFLSKYSEETASNIKFVLFSDVVEELEERFNKDVSHFNTDEINVLLPKFKSSSKQALASRISILNKYTNFAISEGYLERDKNFYSLVDWNMLDNYLNTFAIENKYLNDDEFNDLLYKVCRNNQDRALFRLLFEGVKGKLMAEIYNLKYADIDESNNKLTLTDKDKSNRTIEVERETIRILKDAYNEKEYNVYVDAETDIQAESRKLVKSEYIMQKVSKRAKDEMSYTGLRDRIKGISEFYGNPFLTSTNLWWSGIFWYARKLRAERGELTDNEYHEIITKYNVPTSRGYKEKMVDLIQQNL